MPQFDDASHRIDLYGSTVTIAVNGFDAWRRPPFEKTAQRRPVQRRPVRQSKQETASVVRVPQPPQLSLQSAPVANLGRRLPERGKHGVVELPHAFEPRREGDFSDRQFGFLNQPGGEMNPPRAGDGARRGSQVFGKQPAEVARADAESG